MLHSGTLLFQVLLKQEVRHRLRRSFNNHKISFSLFTAAYINIYFTSFDKLIIDFGVKVHILQTVSSSSVMDDHERRLGQSHAVGLTADLCPVPVAVQGQAQIQSTTAPGGAAAVRPGGVRDFPNAL